MLDLGWIINHHTWKGIQGHAKTCEDRLLYPTVANLILETGIHEYY